MTNISRLERGQAEPNLSSIYKLMDALECDANSLIFDPKKMSVSGVMQEAFKEAERLDEKDQRLIINIIEKCLAVQGVDKLFKEHLLLIQTKERRRKGLQTSPFLGEKEENNQP